MKMKIPFLKKKKNRMPKRSLVSRFDWLNRFQHWYMGKESLLRSFFRVHAAKQTILIILITLTSFFVMAAFYTNAGEFVVKVDRELYNDGFYISEIPNFDEHLATVRAVALDDVTNISIFDIAGDVMEPDGVHHGSDYFAYTFYVKNLTGKTLNYHYNLSLRHQTEGIDEAAWIMMFHNGKQEIFAKESAGGGAECQYSVFEFPFRDCARDPDRQQSTISQANPGGITKDVMERQGITNLNGVYRLETVPFASSKTITTGLREEFEHDGMDKFTVVIWLEGEDPECVDKIIGGELELEMNFYY